MMLLAWWWNWDWLLIRGWDLHLNYCIGWSNGFAGVLMCMVCPSTWLFAICWLRAKTIIVPAEEHFWISKARMKKRWMWCQAGWCLFLVFKAAWSKFEWSKGVSKVLNWVTKYSQLLFILILRCCLKQDRILNTNNLENCVVFIFKK